MKKRKHIFCAFTMAVVLAAGGTNITAFGQIPSKEEQLAMFSDGILDVDAYGYNVAGGYGWGPGADNIPMRCTLPGGGRILVEVRRTDPASQSFFDDFQQQKSVLEQSARDELGPELTGITFDIQQTSTGHTMPIIRITAARDSHTLKATFCYRQEAAYTAEFIGIDDCNDTAVDSSTVQAAHSFTDFGGPAHSYSVRPEVPLGNAGWPYSYFHNPFAVAKYYFDQTFPPPPKPSRQRTDYDLDFSSVAVEGMVRRYFKKGSMDVPLRSSDLDAFTYLRMEEDTDAQMYSIVLNSTRDSFPTFGTTVDTLDDLKEFRNLTSIWLDLPNVSDYSPLGQLTGLEYIMILPGADMKDMNWASPLVNVKRITMWGGSFPSVTDISALQSLTQLETLQMSTPSVQDVSVLAALPALSDVTLFCKEDANLQPLIDAPQIKTLYVNGQNLKEE